MKTHTVRWSGDKSHRIITFTSSFMKLLLTAKHDMAVRVTLDRLLTVSKELTGLKHTIHYEQFVTLSEYIRPIEIHSTNRYQFFAETWMIAGIAARNEKDLEKIFNYLNVIFPALHEAMKDIPNE